MLPGGTFREVVLAQHDLPSLEMSCMEKEGREEEKVAGVEQEEVEDEEALPGGWLEGQS
jgi:hypothetical protein